MELRTEKLELHGFLISLQRPSLGPLALRAGGIHRSDPSYPFWRPPDELGKLWSNIPRKSHTERDEV